MNHIKLEIRMQLAILSHAQNIQNEIVYLKHFIFFKVILGKVLIIVHLISRRKQNKELSIGIPSLMRRNDFVPTKKEIKDYFILNHPS